MHSQTDRIGVRGKKKYLAGWLSTIRARAISKDERKMASLCVTLLTGDQHAYATYPYCALSHNFDSLEDTDIARFTAQVESYDGHNYSELFKDFPELEWYIETEITNSPGEIPPDSYEVTYSPIDSSQVINTWLCLSEFDEDYWREDEEEDDDDEIMIEENEEDEIDFAEGEDWIAPVEEDEDGGEDDEKEEEWDENGNIAFTTEKIDAIYLKELGKTQMYFESLLDSDSSWVWDLSVALAKTEVEAIIWEVQNEKVEKLKIGEKLMVTKQPYGTPDFGVFSLGLRKSEADKVPIALLPLEYKSIITALRSYSKLDDDKLFGDITVVSLIPARKRTDDSKTAMLKVKIEFSEKAKEIYEQYKDQLHDYCTDTDENSTLQILGAKL
jgi:hypothetical protein